MKSLAYLLFFTVSGKAALSQTTAAVLPTDSPAIKVFKDPRLDILAKKEAEFNSGGIRSAKGYRLFIIKSNNREEVMRVRAQLMQVYPEQKPYMVFQAPFIKLKFGDFVEKADAEKLRQQIMKAKIVPGNVYVIPEIVEVKPDKNKEGELP